MQEDHGSILKIQKTFQKSTLKIDRAGRALTKTGGKKFLLFFYSTPKVLDPLWTESVIPLQDYK